jgi:hypothetical protein
MSEEPEFLIVTKARVTNIEFTFDGENPEHVVKRSKRRTGPLSIHPDSEAKVMEAALEAFRKRYPIEIYQDRLGRIVKIQPSK